MTKDEALYKVKGYLTDIIPIENYSEIEEIIKALKQEPCEDCISRQDALKPFCIAPDGTRIPEVDCDNFPVEFSVEFIKKHLLSLPSAEPRNKDAISREGLLLKSWEELSPRGRTEFDQVIMTIPALPSAEPNLTKDGTLKVSVKDATGVGRVLLVDENNRGNLYYPEEEPKTDDENRNARIIYNFLKKKIGSEIIDNPFEFEGWYNRMIWHVHECYRLQKKYEGGEMAEPKTDGVFVKGGLTISGEPPMPEGCMDCKLQNRCLCIPPDLSTDEISELYISRRPNCPLSMVAEPKTGKWIKVIDQETPNVIKLHYECDQCGAGRIEKGQQYCSGCGARMNGGEEE